MRTRSRALRAAYERALKADPAKTAQLAASGFPAQTSLITGNNFVGAFFGSPDTYR